MRKMKFAVCACARLDREAGKPGLEMRFAVRRRAGHPSSEGLRGVGSSAS